MTFLTLRRKVRRLRAPLDGLAVGGARQSSLSAQQRRQRDLAQTHAAAAEEVPARFELQQTFFGRHRDLTPLS